MSQTEPRFTGNSYEVVAFANGQDVVLFQTFGSYQGEWLLMAKDAEQFYVYKGYYGSCSGCDSYEAWRNYDSEGPTLSQAKEFVGKDDYHSFIEIPNSTMENLCRNGTLEKVMPANIRTGYSEVDVAGFCKDVTLRIKTDRGMPITVQDILDARNQEIKQKALRVFGYERFVAEADMEEIDVVGEDKLLRKGDVLFAYVKDSSTPRRYLLRVPPNMKRLKEAIAWTFGMTEKQYSPLKET